MIKELSSGWTVDTKEVAAIGPLSESETENDTLFSFDIVLKSGEVIVVENVKPLEADAEHKDLVTAWRVDGLKKI